MFSMNRLPLEKRTQILGLLVEGNSLRATSRLADVSINTVTKLLVDLGSVCAEYHHHNVRNLKSQRVQCDESVCCDLLVVVERPEMHDEFSAPA